MQTNNTNVKIKLDQLLWRTRSRDQDYQFITSPNSPSIDGWFQVFNEVFLNCEPSSNSKNIIGTLVITSNDHNSKTFQFIASYFIDDNYSDSSGRPIKQYLIWFHQGYENTEIGKLLADDWGRNFISSSKELYSAFHESSDSSKLAQEKYIVIKRSNVDLKKLEFKDIGETKYGTPKIDTVSSQPLYNKILVVLKRLFERVLRS